MIGNNRSSTPNFEKARRQASASGRFVRRNKRPRAGREPRRRGRCAAPPRDRPHVTEQVELLRSEPVSSQNHSGDRCESDRLATAQAASPIRAERAGRRPVEAADREPTAVFRGSSRARHSRVSGRLA
jgi:hypothetical protein